MRRAAAIKRGHNNVMLCYVTSPHRQRRTPNFLSVRRAAAIGNRCEGGYPHLARPAAPSRTIQPASVLTRTGQPDPRHIFTLVVALSMCPHHMHDPLTAACMIGPLALSSCTVTVLTHGPVLGPALSHRHPSCPGVPETGTSAPFCTPGSAAPLLHSPAPLYA